VPTRLRNFEVREVVASGGMGTVYKAIDLSLNRYLARLMSGRFYAAARKAGEKVLWVGQNSLEVVAINHAARIMSVISRL